jgi:Cupin-like domain
MRNNHDESPLYLFDRSFVEKMNIRSSGEGAHYWQPQCFGDDLFALLGDQRPDNRWMIMGPARSGSTFHKDPNATNAWNAVLVGSKYWIMFPSGPNIPPPPGVILSEDASEITSPLSIAEYLLSFHDIARRTPGCKEGVCFAGEILHVPSGWFHLVLNLEESIAITQNFVPRRKLADVLRFLRDSSDQVSGFRDDVKDPYSLFVDRLRDAVPELLNGALHDMEKSTNTRKRKWEELSKVDVDPPNDQTGEFSFGFNYDD